MSMIPLLLFVSFVYIILADDEVFKPRKVEAYPEDFDCPMRQLSLEFAMKIQPFLSKDQLQEIADALNGAQESVNKECVTVPNDWEKEHRTAPVWNDLNDDNIPRIYVDYIKGNDLFDGSIARPVKHLEYAVELARKVYGNKIYKQIILREGRHYLKDTIYFTNEDNNLLISNYNGENADISGAIPLNCEWTQELQVKLIDNVDGVYGGPPPGGNSKDGNIVYLGKFDDFAGCQNRFFETYEEYGFGSFTYQDSSNGDYANMCYGTIGYEYQGNEKTGCTTGVLVNLYSCQVKDEQITSIDGLRVNGTRGIRARFPNGNPEVYPCGFCSSLTAASWVPPACVNQPDIEYYPQTPYRGTSADGEFSYYQLGVGGCCDVFTPNAGYWCGNKTQGGGAFTYLIPSGINFTGKLPNSPYKTLKNAVIQTWRPAHWSSWMFLVDETTYNVAGNTVLFKKGGFQGARGSTNGAEFYIENVREEVDYPTEFFFDEDSKTLYYVNNETGSPDNLLFEVTNLKVLMNFTGTMTNPAKNQMIRGVTIRDAKLTYLDPHGMFFFF